MEIINLDKWENGSYSEESQVNPIRWMNLKPLGGNKYEPVTKWWKCKDFMNEAIACKKFNKVFSIYGFKADPQQMWGPKQKYMYLLVKGLEKAFEDNIKVINKYLESISFPNIVLLDYKDGMKVIKLDPKYLENTLFISTITLYIRLANINQKCSNMEELASYKEGNDVKAYAQSLKKPMHQMPKQLEKYFWYYDEDTNCPKDGSYLNFMTSSMHHCGVENWGWV